MCDLNATHLRHRKNIAKRSQSDIALRPICDLYATCLFALLCESRQVTQLRHDCDIALRHECDGSMYITSNENASKDNASKENASKENTSTGKRK